MDGGLDSIILGTFNGPMKFGDASLLKGKFEMSNTTAPARGAGDQPADRTIDRAAAHVSPALLALRDRLLVALAFASGAFEAICFFSFGKVFTAFQSGNILFLGIDAAGTQSPITIPDPLRVVIALVTFAAGAAAAVLIIKAFNGDEEIEDSEVSEVWPRRVSIALSVSLAVQIVFVIGWLVLSPSLTAPVSSVSDLLIGLSSFAMGLQMNAIRSLHVPAVSTTAVTATFISLVSGATTWSHKAAAARRLSGVLVFMAVGAYIGDWMVFHAHTFAPVLPVLVIAIVIVIASVSLKKESTR
jgi:uncharacterized membrane protein YoaK (UPF0700 family)